MLLAQLTDTHVIDPASDTSDMLLDNNQRLALAVEQLRQETVKPDAILATGDLTDHGTEVEMDLLMELLAPLDAPILAIPGNHDVRSTFAPAFDLPWASDDNLSWSVDVGDLRIIGLDTLVEGSHGGLFDEQRQAWLADALAQATDRPVLIAMHHPPFLSGIGWMDTMGLGRRDAFEELVSAHPNVVRIVCGHLHRPQITTVGGITTSTGPATIHHIELDLSAEARVGIVPDPGGYHLHYHHDGHWVSHIRFIDTGETVRPSWAAG